MKTRKLFDVIGTVLLAAGAFFAFLPHAFHSSVGLEETHFEHVVIGVTLLVVGLGILVYNNKALKIWK